MNGEKLSKKHQVKIIKKALWLIDTAITIIENYDPWGDVDENFKEWDKTTRITDSVRYRLSGEVAFSEDSVERGRLFNEMAGPNEWLKIYKEESIVNMIRRLMTPKIKKKVLGQK